MLMTTEQHPARLYEKQILGTCLVLFLIVASVGDRAAPGTLQLADSAHGGSWCVVYRCHNDRASDDEADPLLPCCISWSFCIARTLQRSVGSGVLSLASGVVKTFLRFRSRAAEKALGFLPSLLSIWLAGKVYVVVNTFAIRPFWAAGSQ